MEKVYVSKNIANYIKLCKDLELDLIEAYTDKHCKTMSFKGNLEEAISYARENQEEFAKAWLFGYIVIEPKYQVKVKAVTGSTKYLLYGVVSDTWYFGSGSSINLEASHTKKALEDAGFGWVLYCDGVTVEEVYEDL